ncbi:MULTISPECIES: hypothetical protein [Halorubrum]|uniref:Uncharacterized protein n=1 Tax=Halorubrum hochstenium ATCC 700873 TaxID=1227481 RepID=M0FD23_9EURY|nr:MULTISPECIES: hypothetical protein [Halorubrum]ELZ57243.1 hypothetical protein C467_06818 [Halorubrum hochstenium ATCC 700873]
MERTRRTLLGVGAALVGTAGCLGVEGVEYPDAPADADAPGDADPPGDDPPEDGPPDEPADDDDGPPALNPALAAATRAVVDDAVWFATEYPEAKTTYQDAVAAAVSTVESVRATVDEEAAIASEQVDAVAAAGEEAVARASEALEPHFSPGPRIRERVDPHVEVLREFAPRDDVDRALEELDRMRDGLASIGTNIYVESAFSRNPIHNRLFRRLLAPLPPEDPERGRVTGGTLVELAVASRGFSTFAYRPYDDELAPERVPRIYGDAFGPERRRELRARLGPIPQPADRVEELFVSFADRPSVGTRRRDPFRGWARELDGVPVHVQRYPDAETAAARLSTALDEGSTEGRAAIDPEATLAGSDFGGNRSATENGTDADSDDSPDADPAGPTAWYRFYHREAEGERYGFDEHAGVQYGYVVRAGEFLLATGFSGDAWEERTGWHGRLRDGWVTGA